MHALGEQLNKLWYTHSCKQTNKQTEEDLRELILNDCKEKCE